MAISASDLRDEIQFLHFYVWGSVGCQLHFYFSVRMRNVLSCVLAMFKLLQ